MKSGLGDRNNSSPVVQPPYRPNGLNEVRSWRPEQSAYHERRCPGWLDVSMESGLGDRNNPATPPGTYYCGGPGLNEIRSWRPEQSGKEPYQSEGHFLVSMKSGLRDRNNADAKADRVPTVSSSQ